MKEVFYGKLVDSDSKDEPALRLLEIIRDEKKNYLDLQSQQINKKTKSKKVMGKEELGILDILKKRIKGTIHEVIPDGENTKISPAKKDTLHRQANLDSGMNKFHRFPSAQAKLTFPSPDLQLLF